MTDVMTLRACCEQLPPEIRPGRHVTVRASTPEERRSLGPFQGTGKFMRAKRYLVVNADAPERWVGAFGMADTASTKAEIVFWAERWASKNGAHFIRPADFKGIEGALRMTPAVQI